MIMKANNGGDADFDGDQFDDNGDVPLEPIFWIRPAETHVDVRRFDQAGPHKLRTRLKSDFARKYVLGD